MDDRLDRKRREKAAQKMAWDLDKRVFGIQTWALGDDENGKKRLHKNSISLDAELFGQADVNAPEYQVPLLPDLLEKTTGFVNQAVRRQHDNEYFSDFQAIVKTTEADFVTFGIDRDSTGTDTWEIFSFHKEDTLATLQFDPQGLSLFLHELVSQTLALIIDITAMPYNEQDYVRRARFNVERAATVLRDLERQVSPEYFCQYRFTSMHSALARISDTKNQTLMRENMDRTSSHRDPHASTRALLTASIMSNKLRDYITNTQWTCNSLVTNTRDQGNRTSNGRVGQHLRKMVDLGGRLSTTVQSLADDMTGAVRVYVRVKFPSPSGVAKSIWNADPVKRTIMPTDDQYPDSSDRPPKFGPFSGVFDHERLCRSRSGDASNATRTKIVTNRDVYHGWDDGSHRIEGARQAFAALNDGYHVVAFGYGFSGSGKTYTLFGDSDRAVPGIITQALTGLRDVKSISLDLIAEECVGQVNGQVVKGHVKCLYASDALRQRASKIDGAPETLTQGVPDKQKMHTFWPWSWDGNGDGNGDGSISKPRIADESVRSANPHLEYVPAFKLRSNDDEEGSSPYTRDMTERTTSRETQKWLDDIMYTITKYRTEEAMTIRATPNNPQSSRSHLYLTFRIELLGDEGRTSYLTAVDMAGREDANVFASDFVDVLFDELRRKSANSGTDAAIARAVADETKQIQDESTKQLSTLNAQSVEEISRAEKKQTILEGRLNTLNNERVKNEQLLNEIESIGDDPIEKAKKIKEIFPILSAPLENTINMAKPIFEGNVQKKMQTFERLSYRFRLDLTKLEYDGSYGSFRSALLKSSYVHYDDEERYLARLKKMYIAGHKMLLHADSNRRDFYAIIQNSATQFKCPNIYRGQYVGFHENRKFGFKSKITTNITTNTELPTTNDEVKKVFKGPYLLLFDKFMNDDDAYTEDGKVEKVADAIRTKIYVDTVLYPFFEGKYKEFESKYRGQIETLQSEVQKVVDGYQANAESREQIRKTDIEYTEKDIEQANENIETARTQAEREKKEVQKKASEAIKRAENDTENKRMAIATRAARQSLQQELRSAGLLQGATEDHIMDEDMTDWKIEANELTSRMARSISDTVPRAVAKMRKAVADPLYGVESLSDAFAVMMKPQQSGNYPRFTSKLSNSGLNSGVDGLDPFLSHKFDATTMSRFFKIKGGKINTNPYTTSPLSFVVMHAEANFIGRSLNAMNLYFEDRTRVSADQNRETDSVTLRTESTYEMLRFMDELVPPTKRRPTKFVMFCTLSNTDDPNVHEQGKGQEEEQKQKQTLENGVKALEFADSVSGSG